MKRIIKKMLKKLLHQIIIECFKDEYHIKGNYVFEGNIIATGNILWDQKAKEKYLSPEDLSKIMNDAKYQN